MKQNDCCSIFSGSKWTSRIVLKFTCKFDVETSAWQRHDAWLSEQMPKLLTYKKS